MEKFATNLNKEQVPTWTLENIEEVSGLTESGKVEEPPIVYGTQPIFNTYWASEELTQAEEEADLL